MDYRDLENLGQQINNKVHNAMDSFDFEKLNQDIRRTADDVISGVKRTINYGDFGSNNRRGDRNNRSHRGFGSEGYEDGYNQNGQAEHSYGSSHDMYRQRQEARKAKPQVKHHTDWRPPVVVDYGFPVTRSPKGEVSGILLTTFGSLGFSFVTLFYIGLWFSILTDMNMGIYSTALGVGFLPFEIGFAVMIGIGTKLRNRVKRFRRYIKSIKGKTYGTFKEFSRLVGKTPKFVARDVSNMLKLGYFPQGHMDVQETCLMTTDSIYDQYLKAMESMKAREIPHTHSETEEAAPKATRQEENAVNELEALGREYMEAIRKANDEIPDTEISNKLYRMELVIKKIFEEVKRHPQKAGRLSQFQNYYMPMTIKLVETYRDIDRQPIQGENIKKAKKDIVGTLDTINEAYEKLYDSMYKETAMDISSDISVLQTLLAQEGLTKSDFDIK